MSTTCLKFLLLCSIVITHFMGIEHIPEQHRDCVLMKLVRIFRGMTFLPTCQTLGQYVRIYVRKQFPGVINFWFMTLLCITYTSHVITCSLQLWFQAKIIEFLGKTNNHWVCTMSDTMCSLGNLSNVIVITTLKATQYF